MVAYYSLNCQELAIAERNRQREEKEAEKKEERSKKQEEKELAEKILQRLTNVEKILAEQHPQKDKMFSKLHRWVRS